MVRVLSSVTFYNDAVAGFSFKSFLEENVVSTLSFERDFSGQVAFDNAMSLQVVIKGAARGPSSEDLVFVGRAGKDDLTFYMIFRRVSAP